LFSLLKLYERRRFVWSATVGLAASIHSIGLVGFGAPIARRLSDSRVMVVAMVTAILITVLGGLGDWAGNLVARALEYWIDDAAGARIRDYLATGKALDPYRLFGVSMTLTLLLAAVALGWRSRLEAVSGYNRVLIPVVVYGAVLFLLFRDFPTLAFRIRNTLVEPVEPILWSSLLAASAARWRPWLFTGVVGYCAAWYFSGLINSGHQYGFVLFGLG